MVNAVGWKEGSFGALTYAVEPLKVKAWPTLPVVTESVPPKVSAPVTLTLPRTGALLAMNDSVPLSVGGVLKAMVPVETFSVPAAALLNGTLTLEVPVPALLTKNPLLVMEAAPVL